MLASFTQKGDCHVRNSILGDAHSCSRSRRLCYSGLEGSENVCDRQQALPVASIIFTSESCRPCQHSLRALTYCRCHKIQRFLPSKLAFELRAPGDVSLCPWHLARAYSSPRFYSGPQNTLHGKGSVRRPKAS